MAKFNLVKLPYSYNALEPFISEETLKVHHGKHLQAYTDKFNAGIEELGISSTNFSQIFSNVSDKPAIRNNGGGYYNHNFYFENLTGNKVEISNELKVEIEKSFGSFDEFKAKFTNMAITNFGSGWTWLAVKEDGNLTIYNTPNQDNFLMDVCPNKEKPIMVIDIWEHAYYIDYQNRRPEYIEKFFNIINWEKVLERFNEIKNN